MSDAPKQQRTVPSSPPEQGRFVEVETEDGRSIRIGTWRQRPDGYWELVIEAAVELAAGALSELV
jgi:hypothetical protein